MNQYKKMGLAKTEMFIEQQNRISVFVNRLGILLG